MSTNNNEKGPVMVTTAQPVHPNPSAGNTNNNRSLITAIWINAVLAIIFWILFFLLYGWLWLVLGIGCTIAAGVCGCILCSRPSS